MTTDAPGPILLYSWWVTMRMPENRFSPPTSTFVEVGREFFLTWSPEARESHK